MARRRLLVIGLDGLEVGFAERLMNEGHMPALAELRRRSARFLLDHGSAQRTGLAWEHVASGLSPEDARRWAAIEFDPNTYTAWQEGTRFVPWWAGLDLNVVVFDTPYVDLRRARNTRGVVAWGAHDRGTVTAGRPVGLLAEFERRFGHYPAREWTYGTPWPSPTRTQRMGEALVHAIRVRSRAAQWLATERLRDWDFFMAVAGEAHGTIEGLWHGIDPSHPLHHHASAPAAAQALRDIHRALDRMVGDLLQAAGDAAIVAFAMGGMGPNHSDAPSMVLLPELLYRHAFGDHLLAVRPEWAATPSALPMLDEEDSWEAASKAFVPKPNRAPALASSAVSDGALRRLARHLPQPVKSALKRGRAAVLERRSHDRPRAQLDLHWQPALRYREHWSRMPAFALPSYYDGRIRINLRGRERNGLVDPARYDETCRALERLLGECRDPRTHEPVVDIIERPWTRDPLALTSSEADLLVIWRGVVAAFEHPRLGVIGPVPLRRTGGHTGRHGVAYVAAPGLEPHDGGVRPSFDVLPTLVELLGRQPPAQLKGRKLVAIS